MKSSGRRAAPTGFRGLLCFNFEQGQRKMVRQLMNRIRQEVGEDSCNVTDIEEICRYRAPRGHVQV